MTNTKSRRWLRNILIVLLILIGAVVWYGRPINPVMPEAVAAMNTDLSVTVIEGPWITFSPTGKQPQKGLIIYPGGRVDPRAYAPLARAIATQGYRVVIVPMPLTLAILDLFPVLGGERAAKVIDAYPSTREWAAAGHSLGAVALSNYIFKYPQDIGAFALLASYPIKDLSESTIPMLSIWGENDALVTPKIDNYWHLLPESIAKVVIKGGNHAQFGYYGDQKGDGEASISREDQHQQVVSAVVQLIEKM